LKNLEGFRDTLRKSHRSKNVDHFEGKPRSRSENYVRKTRGVESFRTVIEWPIIVVVYFMFLNVVNGSEGNNARVYDKVGKEMNDLTLDRIRKLADQCTGYRASWSSARSAAALARASGSSFSGFCR
jgi:hypothetical protein